MSDKSERIMPPSLISSQEGFPAKTSATQENESASTANAAASGLSLLESFANYDRVSCSWKTSQLCLFEDLGGFSETWPRAGLMLNGTAYRQQPLAPLTEEIGSLLLPTPAARDWKDGSSPKSSENFQDTLPRALARLGHPGRMLPAFPEWAMGFPIGFSGFEE